MANEGAEIPKPVGESQPPANVQPEPTREGGFLSNLLRRFRPGGKNQNAGAETQTVPTSTQDATPDPNGVLVGIQKARDVGLGDDTPDDPLAEERALQGLANRNEATPQQLADLAVSQAHREVAAATRGRQTGEVVQAAAASKLDQIGDPTQPKPPSTAEVSATITPSKSTGTNPSPQEEKPAA